MILARMYLTLHAQARSAAVQMSTDLNATVLKSWPSNSCCRCQLSSRVTAVRPLIFLYFSVFIQGSKEAVDCKHQALANINMMIAVFCPSLLATGHAHDNGSCNNFVRLWKHTR